jgi:4-hydroxyproline epimerase
MLPSGQKIRRIHAIDSHTGGEPTRTVVGGGPDLGLGSLAQRRDRFSNECDWFRSAVVNEPRGSDATVGALLCEPCDPGAATAVIFFNNVGYLGMCGHGTIGVIATLAWMGKIAPGEHRVETPAGTVNAILHETGEVTVRNVPSYRLAAGISVNVPGYGAISGDIAWGGNWFFLIHKHDLDVSPRNIEALAEFTWAVRTALNCDGITAEGQEIDHVELFGPARVPGAQRKNFVLCPGRAYDRSPCGTGTSAALACLYADGKLREGETWVQESIIGSVFEGSVTVRGGQVYPSIKGSAFVNAETTLILDPRDPLCAGIRL